MAVRGARHWLCGEGLSLCRSGDHVGRHCPGSDLGLHRLGRPAPIRSARGGDHVGRGLHQLDQHALSALRELGGSLPPPPHPRTARSLGPPAPARFSATSPLRRLFFSRPLPPLGRCGSLPISPPHVSPTPPQTPTTTLTTVSPHASPRHTLAPQHGQPVLHNPLGSSTLTPSNEPEIALRAAQPGQSPHGMVETSVSKTAMHKVARWLEPRRERTLG